jgi:arylsulfatase A-like enzyme
VALVSDNGASAEGGRNGSVNENKFFNGIPDSTEENLQYLDELGSPATYNHYPSGWAWAFNTPFEMWKRSPTTIREAGSTRSPAERSGRWSWTFRASTTSTWRPKRSR